MAVQRVFLCVECDNIYKSKGALKIHVRSFHEQVMHSCNQCGKGFTQIVGLNKHKQAVIFVDFYIY